MKKLLKYSLVLLLTPALFVSGCSDSGSDDDSFAGGGETRIKITPSEPAPEDAVDLSGNIEDFDFKDDPDKEDYAFTGTVSSEGIRTLMENLPVASDDGGTVTLDLTWVDCDELPVGVEEDDGKGGTDTTSVIPEDAAVAALKLPLNILEVPHNFACGNETLEYVVVGEGTEKVGNGALSCCDNLDLVVLPSTLKVIGKYAFEKSGLKTINLPSGLTTIDMWAFAGCKALSCINGKDGDEEVNAIPASVTTVGSGAFEDSGLETITVPWAKGHKPAGWADDWWAGLGSTEIIYSDGQSEKGSDIGTDGK